MTQPPEPKEKSTETPSINDRLADFLIKAIMTGGIAGGGGGALWSLFKDENIPKALASAAIGIAIAYGAKLLEPIHKGNERRLEGMGKGVDRAIDQTAERAIAKVRGVEDWYLRSQSLDCQDYKPEGMEQRIGIFTPMLREVFVPLELSCSSLLPGFGRVAERMGAPEIEAIALQRETISIWDLLKQIQQPAYRQMTILAWGGYGKTTLLKHIAFTYAEGHYRDYGAPKLVPVLLYLRKWRKVLTQEAPPNLPDLITKHHIPSLPDGEGLTMPLDWAKALLRDGKALVMLDGFDEVAENERSQVSRWISAQMRQYPKSVFILTSRPGGYKFYAAEKPRMALFVKAFDAEQRQKFVRQWYGCQERYARGGRDTPEVQQEADRQAADLLRQIEQRQELKDLAKNPLLLNMIATFHRTYPGAKLPDRRAELYQDICMLQLRNRPSAREIEMSLDPADRQLILQGVALEMMQRQLEQIAEEELLPLLAKGLAEQDETVQAKSFLTQIVQVSELLVEREPKEYEFAHLSFQEYLAAVEIKRSKQETSLYPHFDEAWWKPTILLYAAQIKPSSLIQEMVNRGAIDLAYVCFQETTKRIDPTLVAQLEALKQTVQTSRYQQLEDYLKAGQWKKADNETYRLMITTVGKEEGQRLGSDELKNFPCEELLAIDQLWVQYSNGKFGFSVQKKLYLSCGGNLDGARDREAWEKFCHANGWQVNNDYVPVTYNMRVPQAHLPSVEGFILGGWMGGGWLVEFFFSRLADCRLEH